MNIIEVPASEAGRLLPLLHDLHALHVHHQPRRHVADPSSDALEAWLKDWLDNDTVTALAAESPQGALLGYALYEIEERPALPVRAAETRCMLHHIAVAEAWWRMGVGKALVEAMKTRALAQSASVIATTYAPFNAASAGLMQGLGMEPVITYAEWRA
jgi:GNAT superfamily N-acetyltransferase